MTAAFREAAGTARRRAVPAWLREPLLHFVLLGGALFALDHTLVVRAGDPRTIVVGAEVDRDAKALFRASRGREPNAAELSALRQVWLDNEVLYREGLALQLDRGDTGIRERVIFKSLSTIDANLKPPPQDDAVLRAWFEKNRARYDEPARFDFQEAVLTGNGGDNGEAAVREFVGALNGGLPGDARAGLRVFKGRPQANLQQSYGETFAQALQAAPAGVWQALQTKDGWRAIRVDARVAAKPADYAVLRGVVLHDWIDAAMAEQRTAAVRALAKKYRVVDEAS